MRLHELPVTRIARNITCYEKRGFPPNLQAILPFVLLSMNMYVCLYPMLTSTVSSTLLMVELLAVLPVHFLPLINPLITISIVKPYRDALKIFFSNFLHNHIAHWLNQKMSACQVHIWRCDLIIKCKNLYFWFMNNF